ncbi:Wzz/FepE/Etk N-terminal domain-containing protein [Arthrobacter sulfonylureivorans]|uniref:Wzz/FepE/Etk N-terminal domain-containing protein n=1 Tax=Arthrobacter sulfonylureivorans TaxID=2486855 RepID=A0ABY3W460_9MICC|nr:Wzz/FepE/Etk N-terminal domain-containing protein [Arthrobacter sulfonylureivorans]UNK44969.1 Wzz/FepE/Etk N-terminal domain-containing protein [Arthrobacter sulfonylureivorans]
MELRDYGRAFVSRWVIILVLTLAGIGGALAASSAMPRVYEAHATLFVKVETGSGSAYERSQFSLQRVKSYPSLVKSPEVLEPVIRELDLELSLSELRTSIEADNPLETVFLNVTAQSAEPQMAANIANAVAEHLGRHIRRLETTSGDSRVTVAPELTVPASPPAGPTSPRTILNVAVGALIGLSAGLLFAIAAFRLDSRLRTSRDVQSAVGMAVVGHLPRYRSRAGQPGGWASNSKHWMAHRELLTNLLLAGHTELPPLVLLVPASPGAGASFQRGNFALMVAGMGKNICVLETDSALSPAFGQEPDGAGLAEVLSGRADLAAAIRTDEAGPVSYILAGKPEEGIGRSLDRARQAVPVLDELKARFDMTLAESAVTSSPLNAQQLVPSADHTLVICRYGKTKRDDLRRTFAELAAAGNPPQGVVMTGVPLRRRPSAVPLIHRAEAAAGRHSRIRDADVNA